MTTVEHRGRPTVMPSSDVVENNNGSSTINQEDITAINMSEGRVCVGCGSGIRKFQRILTSLVRGVQHFVCCCSIRAAKAYDLKPCLDCIYHMLRQRTLYSARAMYLCVSCNSHNTHE